MTNVFRRVLRWARFSFVVNHVNNRFSVSGISTVLTGRDGCYLFVAVGVRCGPISCRDNIPPRIRAMAIIKSSKTKQPLSSLTDDGQAFDEYMASDPPVNIPADLLDDPVSPSSADPGRSVSASTVADPNSLPDLNEYGKKAKAAHRRSLRAAKQAVESILDLGENLAGGRDVLAISQSVGYGKWVEGLGISRATANKAVRVWERLGHCATLDNMTLTSCYKLAAASTPDAAIDEALLLTEDGPVDAGVVKEVLTNYKPRKHRSNKPEPTVIDAPGGRVVVQPSTDEDDPIAVLQQAIDLLKTGQRFAA